MESASHNVVDFVLPDTYYAVAWVTATGGPGGPWPPHFFAK